MVGKRRIVARTVGLILAGGVALSFLYAFRHVADDTMKGMLWWYHDMDRVIADSMRPWLEERKVSDARNVIEKGTDEEFNAAVKFREITEREKEITAACKIVLDSGQVKYLEKVNMGELDQHAKPMDLVVMRRCMALVGMGIGRMFSGFAKTEPEVIVPEKSETAELISPSAIIRRAADSDCRTIGYDIPCYMANDASRNYVVALTAKEHYDRCQRQKTDWIRTNWGCSDTKESRALQLQPEAAVHDPNPVCILPVPTAIKNFAELAAARPEVRDAAISNINHLIVRYCRTSTNLPTPDGSVDLGNGCAQLTGYLNEERVYWAHCSAEAQR